jgi:SAM-dependent methyltransferase
MTLRGTLHALAPLTGLPRLRRRLAQGRALRRGDVMPAAGHCPLCAARELVPLLAIPVSTLVRCGGCGLVFFDPLPTPQHLGRYYSTQQGYLPSIEQNLRSFAAQRPLWQDKCNHLLAQLRRHDPLAPGTDLLDVGCAYGFFVELAGAAGLATHGLELSTETSAAARARGLDVRTGRLGDGVFAPASMQVVCFDNVLEHSVDPLADLRHARELLRPRGLLYLAVPHQGSLVARHDGARWKMLSWPNHLFYFTRATLARMLEQAGFAVLESFTQTGEGDPDDDRRVVREVFGIEDPERVARCVAALQELELGQELVVIARRA